MVDSIELTAKVISIITGIITIINFFKGKNYFFWLLIFIMSCALFFYLGRNVKISTNSDVSNMLVGKYFYNCGVRVNGACDYSFYDYYFCNNQYVIASKVQDEYDNSIYYVSGNYKIDKDKSNIKIRFNYDKVLVVDIHLETRQPLYENFYVSNKKLNWDDEIPFVISDGKMLFREGNPEILGEYYKCSTSMSEHNDKEKIYAEIVQNLIK